MNINVRNWVDCELVHTTLNECNYLFGRAVVQAVSRWLPTAVARVRVQAENVGFVVDKGALGQVFSENFRFLCQSSFHQFLHHLNHPGRAQ
jgi:hypothetical protein